MIKSDTLRGISKPYIEKTPDGSWKVYWWITKLNRKVFNSWNEAIQAVMEEYRHDSERRRR